MRERERLIRGRYELERKLGEGAFGETWLAIDHGPAFESDVPRTAQHVVVKLTRPGQAGRASHGRERAALATLRNVKQIAHLLDEGADDKVGWLVYEYIEGPDLERALAAGPLLLDHALAITRDLATALAGLHAHGYIHRDLKPSNVLLPADTARHGEAVLLDFGVAGKLRVETGRTMAGQIFGTPRYMAPEQAMGREQSPATDVFELGLLLFEMIYGHPPFSGDSPMQLILAILQQPLVFPDSPPVPSSVRLLIERCLARDPAARPANGGELIRLLAWINGPADVRASDAPSPYSPPVPPCYPVVERPAPSRSKRSPLVLIAAVALLFAAFMAFVLLWSSDWRPSPRGLRIAEGAALVVIGVVGALVLHRFLARRKSALTRDSEALFGRAHTREELSRSIAIDLGVLLQRCEGADERILNRSIALMVAEYEQATASDDRQKALMNAMQLLEKLTTRLAPWYVRNDKLIPTLVGLTGVVSGIVTTALGLLAKK
jgi:serine/threonine protein kinase